MSITFEIFECPREARRIYDHVADLPKSLMCEAFPEDGLDYVWTLLQEFLQEHCIFEYGHVYKSLAELDFSKYDRIVACKNMDGRIFVYVLVSQI